MAWTLIFNGTEKTLADWGLCKPQLIRRSQLPDELSFLADATMADAPVLFRPFIDSILIQRDRVQASDGSWSGGSRWFTGLVIQVPRSGDPRAESLAYKVAGPWWYLDTLPFEQPYRLFTGFSTPNDPSTPPKFTLLGTSSHVFLGMNINTVPWSKFTTGQQIVEILNWVLKPFVDAHQPPPFQIGTITPAVDAPIDEVQDLTCAEAVHKQLRWSPDAVTWFDYTTNPPTFHCGRRGDLGDVFEDVSGGGPVESVRVNARYDLQAPYVLVKYEISESIEGQSSLVFLYDIYPGGNGTPTNTQPAIPGTPLEHFAGLVFTVNLQGTQATSASATIACDTIDHANPDLQWWFDKHPDLKPRDPAVPGDPQDIVSVTMVPGSAARTPIAPVGGTAPADLGFTRHLTQGQLTPWMSFGSQRLTLACQVNLIYRNGTRKNNHATTYQCLSTNATSGTFSTQTSLVPGEPVPIGLAKFIYDAINVLQFDGQIVLQEQECSGQVSLGNLLNLTGGALAEWTTMQALVQQVTEDLETGRTTIQFGPPKNLSAGELVDLLRVNRSRFIRTAYSMRAAGTSANGESQVALGSDTPEKNSSSSGCFYDTFVVSDEPDASAGIISQSIDPVDGPTLNMADNSSPDVGQILLALSAALGHSIQLREIVYCDNGISKARIFLCSEEYDPPA